MLVLPVLKKIILTHFLILQIKLVGLHFFLINLFLAALGLRCFVRALSSCGEWGHSLVVILGLLIVGAFPVVAQGL